MNKFNNSSSTETMLFFSAPAASGDCLPLIDSPKSNLIIRSKPRRSVQAVDNAVYSHIRAIRALGRKTLNTSDIADALSLPTNEINQSIERLKKKGIRLR